MSGTQDTNSAVQNFEELAQQAQAGLEQTLDELAQGAETEEQETLSPSQKMDELIRGSSKGFMKKEIEKLRKEAAKYRSSSRNEVEQIYYKNYWLKARCHKMSPKFAILVFDTAVNMGLARVNQFLKVAEWKYPEKFIQAREEKYKEFAKYGNQKIFLKGWLNRLEALKKEIKIA